MASALLKKALLLLGLFFFFFWKCATTKPTVGDRDDC